MMRSSSTIWRGGNRCGVPLFERGRWRRVSEPREAARNRRLRAVHGSPAEQATIDRGRAEDRRVPKPDRVLAPHRALHSDAQCARERLWRRALPKTKGDGRAGVRADQAQPAHQPVSATRQIRRALRMAADHRHPQPTEASQAPDGRRSGLKAALAATGPSGGTHGRRAQTTGRRSSPPTSPPPQPRAFARHPPSLATV